MIYARQLLFQKYPTLLMTNFLHESPSLKDINRKFNYMSRVTHWLRANRISLNVAKTEIILFRSCRTKMTKKLILDIQCKGQPEAHYSKFSFKQYFPFQHEHLTDLTEIHQKKFFP